ncbi:MAG: nuclear transport factor 2 family protein [Parvularcula sp.]|jgi:ketosteroid isomerase-like protein|nr:nuclear transport factor 2 family protein [Parvularcula sp.]
MSTTADLKLMADRVAITQVLYRLARALDRLDEDALRAVFAEDAHVELGVFHNGGVEGFIPVAMGFMASMERTQHSLSNVLIEISGDDAAVESHVHAQHVLTEDGTQQELLVGARYLTRLRRHGDGWLIVTHTEVMDWAVKRPLGSWFADNQELPKGTRGKDDPSYALFASLPS